MRTYEALYVLKPDLGEEEQEAVITKFTELIAAAGGEVVKLDRWGKRRLAYEVKKLREGYYVLMHFTGGAAVAKELDRVMKITDVVLRQLVVRLENGLPAAEEVAEETVAEVQEPEQTQAETVAAE